MKIFVSFIFVLFFVPIVCLKGQNILSLNRCFPIDGDTVYRQCVTFCSPKKSKNNIFWDFSKIRFLDNDKVVSYKGKLDSTFCEYSSGTVYKYKLQNDSLLFLGYENSMTKLNYLIHFPNIGPLFEVGDSVRTCFIGRGEYSHSNPYELYGIIDMTVDDVGSIVFPENDTICNIVMLKEKRIVGQKLLHENEVVDNLSCDTTSYLKIVNERIKSDSIVWETNTYKWIKEGYRYPIIETVENKIINKGKDIRHYFVSSVFFPNEQEKIGESILETDSIIIHKTPPIGNNNAFYENAVSDIFEKDDKSIIHYLNDKIVLNYNLYQDANVEISIFNVTGIVLYHQNFCNQHLGYYKYDLDINKYDDKILFLVVNINNQSKSFKVLNK